MKKGVLLINLGTPDAPDTKSVRQYLREFLSDPRIIDIPKIFRWLLLNLIILPIRPQKSAKAYRSIWTEQGSPLLCHTQKTQIALQRLLGNEYAVSIGMRYGNPSIQSGLEALLQSGCDSITVMPLFPQYSSAANGSAIESVLDTLRQEWNIPRLTIINDFYDHPAFIGPLASRVREHVDLEKMDAVLMSYHGLPVRHLKKSECHQTTSCLSQDCPAISDANRYCYRAQCFATSEALAKSLSLPRSQYHVCFQSRLGKTPWIQPYTDLILPELFQKGARRIAVVCPSFVADCLETLEEIGLRAKQQWLDLGGESLTLIPCLNEDPRWIEGLRTLIEETHTKNHF